MAKNDSRIKKSFENKTLGGYISIENLEEIDDEENEDIEFKYNMIYDSMGFLTNRNEIWFNKLKQLEEYIIKNNKRPSQSDEDIIIKKISSWVSTQIKNYSKNEYIMNDEIIRKDWFDFITKYKEYFLSNNEIWFNNIKEVEKYIIKNNKLPSKNYKKIGYWISDQKKNYKNNKRIMKDDDIRKAWIDFTTKYKHYFLSNNEEWFNNLKLVEGYIIKNNMRPSTESKDIKIKKLGRWIGSQQKNYKKNTEIMKDETIRKIWEDFTIKYKQYFLSNNEIWFNNLKQVEEYIIKNNKRPSCSKNKNIKQLGQWINKQQINYSNNQQIMEDETIKKIWFDFTIKYKQYFLSNNEEWFNNLKHVEDYINKNGNRPSEVSKDIDIKQLGSWIGTQQRNYSKNEYIMKDESIKKAWVDFNTKYKQYFLSNNEVWFNKLKLVEDYIIKNNIRPSKRSTLSEIKQLGLWLQTQQQNYSKIEAIMKDETIRKLWENFINDSKFKKYFLKD